MRWRAVAFSSFPAFALVYVALYGAFGTESPFLPAFFHERGLGADEIGIVLAAGTIVRLSAGPLLGTLADRVGAGRILALLALASGLVGLLYLAADGFATFLAICMLHSLVVTPLAAIADALALAASAREGVFPYGWIRAIGSAAFIVGTLASGALVASFGTGSIIVASSILFALIAAPVGRLPPQERAAQGAVAGSLRKVLASPGFRRVLIVGGLIIGSHAMSDTFAVIAWRSAGLQSGAIGLLWSEAVLSEVFVFFYLGPRILPRLGPAVCLAIGAAAGILRWATLATAASVAALGATQALHGLTFALVHLACLRLITENTPPQLASTAQSLYGTFALGLASAIFTTLSGFLYQHEQRSAFWLMSLVCLSAIPLALSLQGLSRSRTLVSTGAS